MAETRPRVAGVDRLVNSVLGVAVRPALNVDGGDAGIRALAERHVTRERERANRHEALAAVGGVQQLIRPRRRSHVVAGDLQRRLARRVVAIGRRVVERRRAGCGPDYAGPAATRR